MTGFPADDRQTAGRERSGGECEKKRTRLLARLLLPDPLIELASRIAGWTSDVIFPDTALVAEGRVRALLLNLKYEFHALDIGRHVILGGPSRISLSRGVSLHNNVVIMTGGTGYCWIGERTHVSHGSVIAAGGGLRIGDDCALSSGLGIYTATNIRGPGRLLVDTPMRVAPVIIGDGVLIGANVTILPGVTIGDGAVVGAGAVVIRDVPPDTVAVGIPAHQSRTICGNLDHDSTPQP